MKAILIKKDQHLSWENVPDPVMKDDEILIRIEYAALNRADLMQRAGDYPPPPGAPEWMGLEVSGTIVGIGPVAAKESDRKTGEKVCALLGGGGYAEYVSVRYDMVMPVPQNCGMAEAAALPEAFATAYLNLFLEGNIQPGNTLLMNAGASGLASVIIPMAKAFGIRVITTIIDETKRDAVKALGADVIVNTTEEAITDVLKAQLDAGYPVDVAIDCLGGTVMGDCLPFLSHGARWIMIAALAGQETKIDLKNIYVRNVRIIGSTLRSRAPEKKAQILSLLVRDVWGKISDGTIRPTIYQIFPITEAEDAHALMASGKHNGKIVLRVI